MPVRILIVEDHPIVVSGVRHLLAEEAGCEVVADVPDVAGAIAALSQTPPPDIAIVDIALRSPTGARESGMDVIKWIADRGISTRVIVLSMYDEPAYVLTALGHQVSGYVTKTTDLAGVVKALRNVREGRQYLSESVVPIVAAAYQARARGASLNPFEEVLSARERELVNLIGRGIGIREAAKRMSIVPRSAHQYRANIMRKLGITTYEEFAQWAAKRVQAAVVIGQ